MDKYILAIDQGTTSTRAIIFDQESNLIAIAQKELTMLYPHPGWVEQSANELWASVVSVISEVLAKANLKAGNVAAIGITNQRETTILWEKQSGLPIDHAIVWQSKQSDHYVQKLKEQGLEGWIQKKSGLRLDPYFSASKIRFLLDKHHLQKEAEVGKILFGTVDSFLVWKLTGGKCHISDVSNASRTMLMNLETLDYDDELLELWQIPRAMLPKICDTSAVYGYSDPSLFGEPIAIGAVAGDQQAALFGQTCFEKGMIKNTYGTGCFLLMNTKEQIIHSQNGLISSVGWKIKEEVDYVLEGSVFVADAAVQWLRDGLKIIDDAAQSEVKATSIKSSEGVYVVPAFSGLGAPYWKPQVKGAIFGMSRGTKQAHLIRATLEALAYQTYDVVAAMQRDSGISLERLQVDGGASRNRFLMQFQSDILNCVVERSFISETTALGAAYLAGLAVGYWKDKEAIRANFKVGASYVPQMSEEERKESLAGWEKAIRSAMYFESC